MQYSIVNYKNIRAITEDFRFDADYFKPKYLKQDRQRTHFKNIPIGDFCYVTDGQHGYHEVDESSSIFHLTAKNAKGWFANTEDADRLAKWVDDKNKRSSLKERDLILSTRGTVGLCALVMKEALPANIDQDVARIAIDTKAEVEPEFLLAYLNCEFGQDWLIRNSSGMVQQGLPLDKVRRIPIPLLSSGFQKYCKQIIEVGYKSSRHSETLYLQAEQVILSKLGLLNWKPKHRLSFIMNFSDTQARGRIDAEYFQPMHEEVVKAIKSSKNHACLGDIVSIKKCIEPGSEAYQDAGIPFLRVSNLSKFGINNHNQQFLSESLYHTLKMHQPEKGEILLSKDATPGIAFYLKHAPGKMIPSGGILRVSIKDVESVRPEYLTLVLNSVIVQKQIERDAGGSIINHWLVDQVKNTLIPILPVSTQKEISEKIDESFSNREKSRRLLEIAKRGVEMAIEKNETESEKWINLELKECQINI